ncbi:prevent-host-death protein [Candidatus Termititenax persephonae]|uniref:Antitoxin n=1 Tax=Candidatus Termititenax persephonae TaxID=2218525 RepID=A0A388TFW1_9BACT|nr:prevent-host-death protein [Candidatus Termititenax persephonae]
MPTIQPLSELRTNTTKIAKLAHSQHEPIFITKNGYADLVVLSAEDYEQRLARLEIYDKLAASQAEVASGQKLLPLDTVFAKYQAQYGQAK